ncbi:MAG: TorF family putative porin [Steroidobacter sp.]
MRNLRIVAALGLLTAAGAANAELSSTWTVTNDYDFRGFSQSATDPALQGSLDFAMDNGWYVGAWASNVDFGDADVDIEVDLYTGFSGGEDDGMLWDVGVVYYAYPDESDFNFLEAYGSLGYSWFEGKLWYSNDFGGDATDGDTSAIYLEGNAAFPLPQDFSILLHAGLSTGDYWDDVNGDDQIDYSVGVGYTAGNFDLALKYVDTDSDVEVTDDVFNNEGRVVFTVSTTFPWGED